MAIVTIPKGSVNWDVPVNENFNDLDARMPGKKNLLDNWYFADPIDQRGGYVATPNSGCRAAPNADDETNPVLFRLENYVTAKMYNSSWYSVIVDGVTYYVYYTAVVRGYVDNGYTIDRWKKDTLGTIIVLDDCIEHHGTSHGFYEVLEPDVLKAISGKVCTMSALVRSPNGSKVQLGVGSGGGYVAFTLSEEWTVITRQFVYDYENYPNRSSFVLRAGINDGNEHIVQYKAVKLELGDKQTLAHQDANGNWVLNDPPPNKALELAKCQRYQMVLGGNTNQKVGSGYVATGEYASILIPIPTTMRARPSISVNDYSLVTLQTAGTVPVATSMVVSSNSDNAIELACYAPGLSTYNPAILRLLSGAKIILDANL